jgi:putative restriction endonuclease
MIRNLLTEPTVRDPEIGCTVLTQPFFWPQETWISNPIDFAVNIVRGRYYNTTEPSGTLLWTEVQSRLTARPAEPLRVSEPEPQERYGVPRLVRPRLGQGAFRVLVTDAYQRHCALTDESTLPVLEAAHIKPYAENGPHDPANGILLRSDFHKLFDIGLVTVTPDYRIEISPRIREEWFNGKAYYRLHGQPLSRLPEHPAYRPDAVFLRWHNENRYVG